MIHKEGVDVSNKMRIMVFVQQQYMKNLEVSNKLVEQHSDKEISKIFYKDNVVFIRLNNQTVQVFFHGAKF